MALREVRIKVRMFRGLELSEGPDAKSRLGEGGVRRRRTMGGTCPDKAGASPHVHRACGEGSKQRQSRSHPDHQDLDEERQELEKGLRRGVERRSQARPENGKGTGGRQHGGCQNREYTNSIGATELIGEWTDPTFDPEATRRTTRACWKFHAPLVNLLGGEAQSPSESQRPHHGPAASLDLAHLVHAGSLTCHGVIRKGRSRRG